MKQSLIASIFTFVLIPSSAFATTYYVDSSSTTANDSNPGTSMAAPWKSLAKVNSKALVAGDVVSFKAGSRYTGMLNIYNKSGVSGNPITFNAYGTGAKPVISNASGDSILLDRSNYIVVDGFMLSDSKRYGVYLYSSHHNVVSNCEMTRVGQGVMRL
jgi:parallel beta-helix repeat protein